MTILNKGVLARCCLIFTAGALIAIATVYHLHGGVPSYQLLDRKYFKYFAADAGDDETTEADLPNLCMDDPRLISFIRKNYVFQPNALPYNLAQPGREFYGQYPEVEHAIIELFKNRTKGTFFEGGAFDGEDISGTLHLEKTLHWTGLLVEPFPLSVASIKSKNRKATLVTSCISGTKPVQIILDCPGTDSVWGCEVKPMNMSFGVNSSQSTASTTANPLSPKVWCFPLYSVLLATNYTSIDYMILDMESHEETVLAAFPLDKVNVTVIQIETGSNDARRVAFRALFKRWPMYKEYKSFPIDIVFVNTNLMSI